MGMYDRDWYRDHHREQRQRHHHTQPARQPLPVRQTLGSGFFPGLCLGFLIAPVVTLCILFALGYRL